MKKILSLLGFIFIFSIAFSQQDSLLRSKSGKVILPQKGDIAIGIGANSIFSYLGNLFSSSGTNNFNLDLLNNNQIYVKYYLSSKSAIRFRLGIDQYSRQYINSLVNDLDENSTVTDKLDHSITNLGFTAGYEKRRGTGRLQFSYGAEINLNVFSSDYKYTYGNAFTVANTTPTTTVDFIYPSVSNTSTRPTEHKSSDGIGLGIRAFTGLEYFIFPKISIGGEIGLGYTNYFNGKYKISEESWNYLTNSVRNTNVETKTTTSETRSDILGGQVYLLFHF
jgi:hypothetical protein